MTRYSDEQVEAIMVPKIIDALYPVLIPFEPQCIKIQAENHEMIESIAREVWSSFKTKCQESNVS